MRNAGRSLGERGKDAKARLLGKQSAQEAVRQQITAQLEPLIDEAIRAALGVSYCFERDASTGRWRRVDDERAFNRVETDPGQYLRNTGDPSPRAFAELLDRSLDKPRRQEQEVTVSGEVDVVARLAAARRAKPVVPIMTDDGDRNSE
jgi:hypothetical protein